MKYKVGKYYLLDISKYYWIPCLQTRVKFENPVAIKLTNFVEKEPAFGKLVIIGKGGFGTDLEINEDVEINSSSLIKEYELNSNSDPLFYMDFIGFFN